MEVLGDAVVVVSAGVGDWMSDEERKRGSVKKIHYELKHELMISTPWMRLV